MYGRNQHIIFTINNYIRWWWCEANTTRVIQYIKQNALSRFRYSLNIVVWCGVLVCCMIRKTQLSHNVWMYACVVEKYMLYNIHKQVKGGCATYNICWLVLLLSMLLRWQTQTQTTNIWLCTPVPGKWWRTHNYFFLFFILFYNRSSKACVW